MSALIAKVRLMIADPAGGSQFFADQDIQDALDDYRDDVRYEPLQIAPSIVNVGGNAPSAQTIFADYYSAYKWWEADVVLQGNNISTGAAWVVLTPVTSDYIVGHFQFEADVFNSPSVPGQYPPIFATGKVFDLNAASADLLEFWAASLAGAYDITVDGQSLKRSQLPAAKLTLAAQYRRKAKARVGRMVRRDVAQESQARRYRLLDSDDIVRGA